jgi:hypothetical protein
VQRRLRLSSQKEELESARLLPQEEWKEESAFEKTLELKKLQ